MKYLLRVSNLSAVVWIISIIGIVGVIAIASKFMTYDPDFSPGDPENVFLLPMLLLFFTGVISFGVMILTGLLALNRKQQLKAFVPFKYIAIAFAFISFGLFSFIFAIRQQNLSTYNTVAFTGDDVFKAVNEYRVRKNLQPLEIDPVLCDNLVERYLAIKNPNNGHAGFEEWAKNEGIIDKGYALAELYNTGAETAEDAVRFWDTSPGHKSALIGGYTSGCAYSNEGISVVVLGIKNNPSN